MRELAARLRRLAPTQSDEDRARFLRQAEQLEREADDFEKPPPTDQATTTGRRSSFKVERYL